LFQAFFNNLLEDLDGALHRINDAGEFGEDTITGGIDEAPVMLLDARIDYFAVKGQGSERQLLIFPHEAAIAVDVGAEYGGELALHYPPLMMAIILPRAELCQMTW
jgi:hypothetical protein